MSKKSVETQCCCPPGEKSPVQSAPKESRCPPQNPEPACCPPPATPTKETGCCPPPAKISGSDCCAPSRSDWERPGYRLCAFVTGWLDTAAGQVPSVATRLTRTDLFGRWQMRWGIGRERYRVAPGLYAVGKPDAESPVLVTANYKLSFDALRRELMKINAWILVLDTRGINVWCAAGKGTFGTEEIIRRVKASRLDQVVSHRRLILPQLGAPGVAAHEVAKGCGFRVAYGPVRASDLPAFLHSELRATPAMRRVTFSAWERLILTPVELVMMRKTTLWAVLVLLLLGGIGPWIFSFSAMLERGGAAILVYGAGLFAGAVLTPLLLPWVPGTAFSWKGGLVGLITGLLLAMPLGSHLGAANTLALLLALTSVASWCAMNFTGSTTFTSPSGVEWEMRRAIPLQALALAAAGIAWLAAPFA